MSWGDSLLELAEMIGFDLSERYEDPEYDPEYGGYGEAFSWIAAFIEDVKQLLRMLKDGKDASEFANRLCEKYKLKL